MDTTEAARSRLNCLNFAANAAIVPLSDLMLVALRCCVRALSCAIPVTSVRSLDKVNADANKAVVVSAGSMNSCLKPHSKSASNGSVHKSRGYTIESPQILPEDFRALSQPTLSAAESGQAREACTDVTNPRNLYVPRLLLHQAPVVDTYETAFVLQKLEDLSLSPSHPRLPDGYLRKSAPNNYFVARRRSPRNVL